MPTLRWITVFAMLSPLSFSSLLNAGGEFKPVSSTESEYLIFEYPFPVPQYDLKPTWHSAMAQAESATVLFKAFKITGNTTYLDTANRLLKTLFVEVDDGGVTYKTEEDGWWYELYANRSNDREPRVLNGMLITVLALYDYYNYYTGDPDARYLFEQGVKALKKDLNKYIYDDSYTYYDLCCGNLSPISYHDIVVNSLSRLYNVTGEPIFKSYYEKWANHEPSKVTLKNRSPEFPHLIYDSTGVPILDYGHAKGVYIGLQRNPITIAHYADQYYNTYLKTRDEKSKQYFLNCANWLVENPVKLST